MDAKSFVLGAGIAAHVTWAVSRWLAGGKYTPPKVWKRPEMGGTWGKINSDVAGPRTEATLKRGEHALQLYSLGTPNGVKVTALLEELCEEYGTEYDAWLTTIRGEQFTSGFVKCNPNSKIPALHHYPKGGGAPVRVFESGSIMLYLCDTFDHKGKFLPKDPGCRAEVMNWVFWQMASAPYIGGGFGHFYRYAPVKIKYAIDRFTMETKRLLSVLDNQLIAMKRSLPDGAEGPFVCGAQYTIADMAIWPWLGNLVLGRLYDESKDFLSAESAYPNVLAWATLCWESRPNLKLGRKVNRSWGAKSDQLPNRHSRSDFASLEDATAAEAKSTERNSRNKHKKKD